MGEKTKKLVLLRHGQSSWNLENKFSGWTDVDLSERGRLEAFQAGELLLKGGYVFDIAFTSVLKRAIRTLWIVLDCMDSMWTPVHTSWKLNEKHYGALQGLDKKQTVLQYGHETVEGWRRGFDTPSPPMSPEKFKKQQEDRRYRHLINQPATESLRDTQERVLLYWKTEVLPALDRGQSVLIVAHGNSLRSLVKYLDGISDEDIIDLNIPTGIPLVYELDTRAKPLCHYYLGDQFVVQEAIAKVALQTGAAKK